MFDKTLGDNQYYPHDADHVPENRTFAQFHAPQTTKMKEQILGELTSPNSKIRVVFATIAIGMGVDIPSIRHIIHIGPPSTIREYMQETGRDGHLSTAVLFYNIQTLQVTERRLEMK